MVQEERETMVGRRVDKKIPHNERHEKNKKKRKGSEKKGKEINGRQAGKMCEG